MANNTPTHTAYSVRDYKTKDGKDAASWTRIGSVWTHEKGDGFTVRLDLMPMDGEIVIRPRKEKQKEATGEADES